MLFDNLWQIIICVLCVKMMLIIIAGICLFLTYSKRLTAFRNELNKLSGIIRFKDSELLRMNNRLRDLHQKLKALSSKESARKMPPNLNQKADFKIQNISGEKENYRQIANLFRQGIEPKKIMESFDLSRSEAGLLESLNRPR